MDKEKNKLLSNKAYSKSSFILLKSDKGYDAYVMTLVADSDYINKHPEKLNHNTYSKRDADFSGLVLYFTPKGKYVCGWRYKNGNILQPSSSNMAQPGVTKTQSITHTTAPSCLDWYLVTYEDDVRVSEIYLYTTCTSGADEGGGGGATAPPQCPTTGKNTDAVAVKAPGKATNATPPSTPQPTTPGDGGGFPPPSSDPCTVVVPEPEESDPCDEMKKDKDMLPSNLNNTVSAILSKPGTNEWGADLRLSSLTSRTYNPTSITSGVNGAWDGTFTWNPSEGFSIGAMHKHFATGPSPDDVFSFVKNRQKLSDIGASDVEKQFYEKNSYEIVVLNNATFMITVNPGWWGTLKDMSNNGTDYEAIFQNQTDLNQEVSQSSESASSVIALKQIFGDAINIYQAPIGTTNFAIAAIDQNGKLIIVPCP